MNRPSGTRRTIALSALVLGALLSACGTKLTEAELATANGPLQVEASGAAAGGLAAGSGAAAGGAATGSAGAAAGGLPADAGAADGSGAPAAGGGTATPGAAGAGGAATAAAAGCPDPCAPIVFGSIGTASGALGAVTGPAVPAIKAWVSYINANGGLGGHQVEVVIADVAGDPTRAVSTARQMVEERGVDAMFYDFAFTELTPVVQYLDSVQVPLIGSIGGDATPDHFAMYFNPLVGPDIGQSWGFINAYRAYSDAGRIGSIYCREAAVCASLNEGFSRFLPYDRDGVHQELVYTVQASLVQPNFTAEVIGAQQNDVEVLLGLMDTASIARIAQAVNRQQGYKPLIAGTYNINQDLILRYPELEGVVLTGRVAPWDSSPKLATYRAAMDRYQPSGSRGDVGAGAFVVGALLQKYAGALPGDPGPADFLNLLYSIHGETLDGLLPGITFHPGDKSDVNQCIVPMQLRSGAFVAHDAAESFVCAPGWKPGT
jgi:branched-chain amino acid transport system substrate-binding protein